MNGPLRVYLDSSDFSILSNSRVRDESLTAIVTELRRLTSSGDIACYFSGTLLCEIAPLNSAASASAALRAELLLELCGRNALISQDRLITAELAVAMGNMTAESLSVCSKNGEWYPDGTDNFVPVTPVVLGQDIKDELRGHVMSRPQRREAERRLLKGGKVRASIHTKIIQQARASSLDDVLREYPMRPEDARTLMRFFAGDASREAAVEAYRESLRDPKWMLHWLSNQPEKQTQFIEWLRGPAADLLSIVLKFRDQSTSIASYASKSGSNRINDFFSPSNASQWQEASLVSIANRLAGSLLGARSPQLRTNAIDSKCPGLSTGIRAILSAWWQSTGKTPRTPLASDFADALHAMYAPYVDVFRADSFMASHIAPLADLHGTAVVHKLRDLVPTIHDTFRRRTKA